MSHANHTRREILKAIAAGFILLAPQLLAATEPRRLREMQIFSVSQLGLKIWVENQPTWEADLNPDTPHPTFIAQSPSNYHPPTVMTYASWIKEKVTDQQILKVADTAISRASQNFGLNKVASRSLTKTQKQYGDLTGLESTFVGKVQGVPMDVKIFVGQADGKFPVALSIYTLKDKMPLLEEVIRRSWGKLAYL